MILNKLINWINNHRIITTYIILIPILLVVVFLQSLEPSEIKGLNFEYPFSDSLVMKCSITKYSADSDCNLEYQWIYNNKVTSRIRTELDSEYFNKHFDTLIDLEKILKENVEKGESGVPLIFDTYDKNESAKANVNITWFDGNISRYTVDLTPDILEELENLRYYIFRELNNHGYCLETTVKLSFATMFKQSQQRSKEREAEEKELEEKRNEAIKDLITALWDYVFDGTLENEQVSK